MIISYFFSLKLTLTILQLCTELQNRFHHTTIITNVTNAQTHSMYIWSQMPEFWNFHNFWTTLNTSMILCGNINLVMILAYKNSGLKIPSRSEVIGFSRKWGWRPQHGVVRRPPTYPPILLGLLVYNILSTKKTLSNAKIGTILSLPEFLGCRFIHCVGTLIV
jgi:hypothetical protein